MSTDETAPDFAVVMRGYDRAQVDRHLGRTATRITELRERVARLERELEEARATAPVGPADDLATMPVSERFSVLGEETTRILVAAEESAREMRERAARQADAELAAADRAARDRVERASEHAARLVADAEAQRDEVVAEMRARVADAEAELERLEGVRRDLVTAMRVAVEATTMSVADLEEASLATPAEDDAPVPAEDDATVPTEDGEGAGDVDQDAGDVVVAADDEDEPATAAQDPAPIAAEEDEPSAVTEDSAPIAAVGDEPSAVTEDSAPIADEEPAGDADEEHAGDADEGAEASVEQSADRAEDDPADDRAAERHGAAPSALRSAVTDAVAATVASPAATADDAPADERRDEALAAVRPGALRRLRRGLQDLQNGILQRVRERTDGDAGSLLPGGEAAEVLAGIAAPFLDGTYRAGVADAAALARVPVPEDVPGAHAVVADASDRLGRQLLDELCSTLLPSLRAGIEADEADASLSERVGEVFRDLKGPIVEIVVDRHLTAAYGRATLDTWRQQDVARVVWVLGEESRCPEGKCRTNAAEGPVAPGQEFPSGDALPQVHDGCTCALAPVTTAA